MEIYVKQEFESNNYKTGLIGRKAPIPANQALYRVC